MARQMGRKTMLKVASAVADGIDPKDLAKLKTKVFKPLILDLKVNILLLERVVKKEVIIFFVYERFYNSLLAIFCCNK